MIYSCYGLVVASRLRLPELLPLAESSTDAVADVRIGFEDLAAAGLEGGRQLGPFLWVRRDALRLQVPGVAIFLVRGGREILIDPEPGVDEESIRVFLLGSAFGALLFQRGHLVLHGNAVRIGNHCLVCIGRSGAGKSTLAAGFLRRGYPVLADDIVPVDDELRAVPGLPRVKLWRASAGLLGIDVAGLPPIRPGVEKFSYPLAGRFVEQPLPIRWIYHLDTHPQTEPLLESIPGMKRLKPLHNHTYRVRYLSGMELEAEHLRRCGRLADRIHLARLLRPEEGGSIDALIDRIVADVEANP